MLAGRLYRESLDLVISKNSVKPFTTVSTFILICGMRSYESSFMMATRARNRSTSRSIGRPPSDSTIAALGPRARDLRLRAAGATALLEPLAPLLAARPVVDVCKVDDDVDVVGTDPRRQPYPRECCLLRCRSWCDVEQIGFLETASPASSWSTWPRAGPAWGSVSGSPY